jgi:Ca-activated chloride channel family protein
MRKIALALVTALVAASPSYAAGLLQPKDGSLPPLEIKDHKVRVVINNGFAVTEVDQVFHNPHDRDLQAVYTFPLPKDASLSELSLWIDGHEVVGEVIEKEEARKVYKQEQQAGHDTALAEKREYHAFDVFVSPVRTKSDTRVRLLYLQPLEIDAGVGRYVYPLQEGRIDEEAHAFWDRLPVVHGSFSFQCLIRTAYPLEGVRTKGMDDLTRVTQSAPDTWIVNVEGDSGAASLDQDIVVYYSLARDLPARVELLPHRSGGGEGTFLLVVTPGADLRPITEGIDWSVVLDVSGSMQGKIATAADAVNRAFEHLRPEDRFRIVVFSNGARELMPWTPVTPGSVEEAHRRLSALGVEGGTNLHAGVAMGLDGLQADRTSALILVSDGGANVGPTEHRAFLRLLDRRDVRVFTFVLGQGANVPLMERLAKDSGGFSMDVSNQDDLYGRLLQVRAKLSREALHGVRLELEGVPVSDLAPSRMPSAYFGQQIAMFGRYDRPGEARLTLRARISGQEKSWSTRITLPETDETYPELERLWALARIKDITEQIHDGGGGELRKAIVDLGTRYSIVTDHTSMIVVPEERFEEHGIDRKNKARVDEERKARAIRMSEYAKPTRADESAPMFPGATAPHVGGGGGGYGGGAAGPEFLALLAALAGARKWLGRRSREGKE